ncbi:MAG: T9SS type A sorting domain-containing protein [Ignavibacteriae bacterium]|nr:T9SS type A sorting domain-containing protein [Ignavibacteriota bacterium]
MKLKTIRTTQIALLITILAVRLSSAQWQSARVRYDGNNRLVYTSDPQGNRIPDFSHAGYKGGGVAIPSVPVAKTISPTSGDNTVRIQAAIDSVGAMPIGSDGMRGALLLSAGTYDIYGTLRVKYSGVVLRGVGDGNDPATNTIVKGRGNTPDQRTIVIAGGGSQTLWRDSVSGTKTNIISDSIAVGSRSFRVQNAAPFTAGDNIIIYHPCTAAWLQAIDHGGTHSGEPGSDSSDVPWEVNSQPIVYNRYITRISGDTITIDAPVFSHLVRRLSQVYIYKYSRNGLKTNIGIENLRVDIETAGGTDEAHAWNAIDLMQVEDAWVKNCTMLHFGHAGVRTQTATRVTIDSCEALDPVSIITGERRYNFCIYTASQHILVSNCRTTNGRHDYVSNGTSWTSGCVFLDCVSDGTNASSEGHRRWTTGFLFDNITFRTPNVETVLGLYNRGYYGTSHGWAIAHSVAWNCDATSSTILVQQPPTAQNYAIGCKGIVAGTNPPAPFNHPQGFIEGSNQKGLQPRSLYLAQLADRLGPTAAGEDHGRGDAPTKFMLRQNYPNPFNPSTTIRFTIPIEMGHAPSVLRVYDVLGKEVATLVHERKSPGTHDVTFDARRPDGQATVLPSGVYFCRLQAGGFNSTIKMLLAK